MYQTCLFLKEIHNLVKGVIVAVGKRRGGSSGRRHRLGYRRCNLQVSGGGLDLMIGAFVTKAGGDDGDNHLVLQLLIGFGLAFELPLLLLLLGRLGLVSTAQMRQYRRHVIVGILVLAMLLTPPDVASQLEMAIPLYLLYELCILILSLRDRTKP